MSRQDRLLTFVRDALAAGHDRGAIETALLEAGWTPREAKDALAAFAATAFLPPVPRPSATASARDFFFYAVLFSALGVAAFSLNGLIHELIDYWLPDPARPARWREQAIRWDVARLVVSAPLFLLVGWRLKRMHAADPGGRRSAIRKWLTYLALLLAALVFLGDAIYVVYRFLDGDLPLRFVLKATSVAIISAAIFAYYLDDAERDEDA